MRRFWMMVASLGVLSFGLTTLAQEQGEGEKKSSDDVKELSGDGLTLERLFPEKSPFGPGAFQMAFSHDGRYAAYLYRPRIERRHGSDLWLYDTESGEGRRITSATVMARFQESARTVRDDRIEKAKRKRRGGAKSEQDDEGAGDTATDPVSGVWEGKIRGLEDMGIPPEGLDFTLTLQLDGETVTGQLTTAMSTGSLSSGRFDAETGELSCTIVDAEAEVSASLTAEITDEEITGEIYIEAMDITLTLTGKRTEKGAAEEEVEEDQEQEEEEIDDEDEQEELDDDELGDLVDEKDAEDDKSPRYAGISSYVWAPNANEMIVSSGGDLYRFDVESEDFTRLTRTQAFERGVEYLPDGSGYSYMRDDAIIRIVFGSHLIEQLDPDLPAGESLSGYEISPDGRRLAMMTTKGSAGFGAGGRGVKIVNYRGRFAEVREVPRHMPDDPFPESYRSIYLYDFDGHLLEEGQLKKVYTHKQSGPRDAMPIPAWAPDSSKVAFAVYDQGTGEVEIIEAGFRANETGEDEGADEDDNGNGADDSAENDHASGVEITDARVVYKFLHYGGPNTPVLVQPQYLADSQRIAFVTELSGYRHLHVLDPVYEHLTQLTNGRWEVYPFDISEDHTRIYAMSNMDHPSQTDIIEVNLETGDTRKLTSGEGVYSGSAVSDDGAHALATYVDFGQLRELYAINDDETQLTESHTPEAHKITEPTPEYFSFLNRHGQEIHGHMFKPDGWTKDDKRPMLLYVYGGPLGSNRNQLARGSYSGSSYYFAYYMAKKHGYVTCTIDPRGVSGYGGLFEKSNFEQVGKPQVEDLVDGVKWFVENQGVDPDRVGMHGWSFGGFQTQMCLYTEPDVFACGIAGAGPTEWFNYNSWYTTGTVGEKEGLSGKEQNSERYSLLPLAKNLKARLLLIHGMEDSNVLYQDTVRVYRELLKAGKETLVELFLDPTGGHGLGGDVKTINRYRKYEEFLLRCLGDALPDEADESEE